jgi:hypothetical protein
VFEKMKAPLVFVAVLIAVVAISFGIVEGASWLVGNFFTWLRITSLVLFIVIVLIMMPLSIPARSRTFAVTSIAIASIFFLGMAWVEGVFVTIDLWGAGAAAVGFALGGLGVIPVGMLATACDARWPEFFEILALVVATIGCKLFANWRSPLMPSGASRLNETNELSS